MFGKKNTSSPKIDKAVAQGVSFELTIVERARRSEKRAWIVAWCAVFMSLVLAGGYFLFLPLKEKVPYLVMADPYTGTASVAKLVGDFNDRDVTTEEAINKSNVAQFVLARESFDSGLIGQRNWQTTLSMASPAVAPAYMALHAETNPERPFRIYGATRSVRVRILSIVLHGGGPGKRPTGATVRFQRNVFDKGRGRSEPLDSKIATLEFTYNPDLRLNDEYRLINPLGFRVVNYRVDNDFASGPVPEREFSVPAATAPAAAGDAPQMPQMPGLPAPQGAQFPDQSQPADAAEVPQPIPQPAEQAEPGPSNGAQSR